MDQFEMVGTLSRGVRAFVLLRAANTVYRLAVGDYLGPDHGRVTAIHERHVELVELFILGIHHGVIDWIVVLIFCGYVGVDWGRANQIPKTLDNAIDSAAALYMDIINLFLRILRILGRK